MLSDEVILDAKVRERIVETKVTCPFLGSVVNQQLLSVRGSSDNPLASIEDVRELGNRGGGDLGDLLVLFAAGNHALMRGGSENTLDVPAPAGLFSLELPGSQGSHPGHSGILQEDPRKLDSGRLSIENFDRLAALAKNDLIKRSDIGHFIAENLRRDPRSKVNVADVAELWAQDVAALAKAISAALISRLVQPDEHAAKARVIEEKFTKLLGEDNLVGSSGEFGLLLAFLGRGLRSNQVDGELAVSLEDVRAMFCTNAFQTVGILGKSRKWIGRGRLQGWH
jgi:hypothetical protein